MTTIDAGTLAGIISSVFRAHHAYAKKGSKRFRKWDGKTPYGIHPTWSALTLLTETTLDEWTRTVGVWTLLNHDLLEDTSASLILPKDERLRAKITTNVKDMSKKPGESKDEEFWRLINSNNEIILFTLYDKVSNLLDGAWMDDVTKTMYTSYVRVLADNAFKIYGDLNIVKIARSII